MKSIVIPTDFSENSIHAIDFAVHRLGDEDCTFTILHVYQIPQGGQSGLFYLLEEMQKQADADMKELMGKLSKRYANKTPKFESKVLQGDLADQCNAVARDLNADCLAMGTKGATGLKEVLVGSNAVRLMTSLKRPMYAIPAEHEYKAITEMIVAYDGKGIDQKVSDAIKAFASRHQLPIIFMHIRTEEDNPIQDWKVVKNQFDDLKLEFIEKTAENFESGLQAATDDKEAILVLIRHKQSFWERLFNISDSRKALMHAKIPVLVIPE